jgi:hypothetical protein
MYLCDIQSNTTCKSISKGVAQTVIIEKLLQVVLDCASHRYVYICNCKINVLLLTAAQNIFTLHSNIQTRSETYLAFYPIGRLIPSPGIQHTEHEADHSPNLMPTLRMYETKPSVTHMSAWHDASISTGKTSLL